MSQKKKTLAVRQRTAAIIALVLIVLLALVYFYVDYLVSIDTFIDIDGTEYTVKTSGGVYALYDSDGNILDTTVENNVIYYMTNIGTLVRVDERGDTSIYAVVDTDDGEDVSTYNNLMIYPKINPSDIKSIEINLKGEDSSSYKFYRNSDNAMVLSGNENVQYDAELYSWLAAVCGNTTVVRKISKTALDTYGYEEYGLDDPQASYTIKTDKKSYTIDIGNKIVSGNGYYVKLDGRDSVYIMNSQVGKYVLQAVEYYITPKLGYGITESNYMFVHNLSFVDFIYGEDGSVDTDLIIALSYWPYEEREGTEFQTQAYSIHSAFDGYTPSSDAVYSAMSSLTTFDANVVHLGLENEALAKYGLDKPDKTLYFEMEAKDSSTGDKFMLKQTIYFSELTENGTYYAYTTVKYPNKSGSMDITMDGLDFIVEVDKAYLNFLDWETLDWIERNYFQINIGICQYVEFELADGSKYAFAIQMNADDTIAGIYSVKNGKLIQINTTYFQTLYLNMLGGKLFGSADLSDEEETLLTESKDKFRLSWTFTTSTGLTRTHKYYQLDGTKDYITINDNGGFYVLSANTKKLAEDIVKVYNNQKIEATSPYTNIDK